MKGGFNEKIASQIVRLRRALATFEQSIKAAHTASSGSELLERKEVRCTLGNLQG